MTGNIIDKTHKLDWRTIFFPGLFFNVYIEIPNPKKPRRPHTTGPKPQQLKAPTPKTQNKTPTPKPPTEQKSVV